jgi:hypothetical protein
MPNAMMGDKLKEIDRGSGFINLKAKGDKAQIRFIRSDFYYSGKHFSQGADNKWIIQDCSRINEGNPCDTCQKAFDILKELKGVEDENVKKEIKKRAREFQPNVSFYYTVLDRETGEAKIFQTTVGIRIKLDAKLADGEKIMNYDYVVKRTEVLSSYYTIDRVDSADTKELTEKELKEVEMAQGWNVQEMVDGNKSAETLEPVTTEAEIVFTGEGGQTEPKKDVVDEIPF